MGINGHKARALAKDLIARGAITRELFCGADQDREIGSGALLMALLKADYDTAISVAVKLRPMLREINPDFSWQSREHINAVRQQVLALL